MDRHGRLPGGRRLLAAALGVLLVAGCTGASGSSQRGMPAAGGPATTRPAPATGAGPLTPEGLRAAVTVTGIRRHLAALQAVAERHGGNRAAGTPGYDASVAYVAAQLQAAGYRPQLQRFEVATVRDNRPPVLEVPGGAGATLRAGTDYRSFGFSGNGEATGPVRAVDLGSPTSGCQPADFAGFPRGSVAVLARGGCAFRVKAEQAQRAGAVAGLLFDPDRPGPAGLLAGTLGGAGISIPVLATTREASRRLVAAGPGQRVRVSVDASSTAQPTSNLVAELAGVRGDRVVMVGAHLDSVAAGPGLNDNASGSATVLELARQLAGSRPHHTIRFAWWGGEELGLLGSRHYLASLDQARRQQLAVYLNLDMLGSPNFRRLVYDGDRRGAPPGSKAVEQVLTEQLRSQGLAVGETTLAEGSDHAPFAAAGIPVGGLFSGAGEAKDARERAAYGGTAGAPADPCYHRRCDDLDNLDLAVLDQLADATAHAVASFARDLSRVDRARARG
jgi:Zn-dependent M28 family amino/carboxypeptidase